MKIFISRDLSPDSFFQKKLTAAGHEVIGQSLIEFTPTEFELPLEMDWLFFYSQNGVRFFFEKIKMEILPKVKIGTIGPATTKVVKGFGKTVNFKGDGDSKTTAEAFLKIAAGERVVFPRAMNSRRSVQLILGEKIEAIDLIVYQNLPKKNIELPDCEALVLTSPMNAQVYFSKKKWREGQRVIAIGETTAGTIRALGIEKVEVAAGPSEAGLVTRIVNP